MNFLNLLGRPRGSPSSGIRADGHALTRLQIPKVRQMDVLRCQRCTTGGQENGFSVSAEIATRAAAGECRGVAEPSEILVNGTDPVRPRVLRPREHAL